MLEVKLTGLLRTAVGGAASVSIEAATIDELFRELVKHYPQLGPSIEAGLAVSINGDIYRDDWAEQIPADADVFLLPRIQGG